MHFVVCSLFKVYNTRISVIKEVKLPNVCNYDSVFILLPTSDASDTENPSVGYPDAISLGKRALNCIIHHTTRNACHVKQVHRKWT